MHLPARWAGLGKQTERVTKQEGFSFSGKHGFGGHSGGAPLPEVQHLLACLSLSPRLASLTLLPAEGAARKPAGARSSMSAREAGAAAALVAARGAEGAELLAPPAPGLFPVNNQYSHRRPRLVCAPPPDPPPAAIHPARRGEQPGPPIAGRPPWEAGGRASECVAGRGAGTAARGRDPDWLNPKRCGLQNCP